MDSEIENYWSVKTLYHGLWAIEIISRFRYKPLMAFLNIVDPVTEDYSNKLHQQLYQPSQNIAVDEHTVKSRNRLGIRQFMKDGLLWINLWVAADSPNAIRERGKGKLKREIDGLLMLFTPLVPCPNFI